MKTKICLALILLFVCLAQIVFAQEKSISGGIVNGRATKLPHPVYSQEAKDLCASGKVEVEVLIDERGNVISAKAISGDELLRDSAVEAARQAKFAQINDFWAKVKGIIVYNFPPTERKCIDKGVVNSLASYLPFPTETLEANKACVGGKVEVALLIDSAKGKVIFAKAISGNELLRKSSEETALEAKFNPAIIDGANVFVRGKLVYEFAQPKCINVAPLNEKALSMPKPEVKGIIRSKYLRGANTQTVVVRVIVNANGDVSFAEAVSGHPLLRPACEASARQAKFPPTTDAPSNKKQLYGILIYKIKPDGTVEF